MSLPTLPPIRAWYRRVASRAAAMPLFEALYGDEDSAFLYESLEAHGGAGRYSFVGAKPRAVFKARGNDVELHVGGQVHRASGDPLAMLRELNHLQEDAPPVAPFGGGAVGYLSYDTVRWCENIPDANPDDLGAADAHFLFPQEVICFDHLEKVVHILLYRDEGHDARLDEIKATLAACEGQPPPPWKGGDGGGSKAERGANSVSRRSIADENQNPPVVPPERGDGSDAPGGATPIQLTSNMTQQQFEEMVLKAKEYILAGDIFQVVLSQRFEFPVRVPPIELYRALRVTNPSPYMYYLRLGDLNIVGSSPEILVRQIGRKVVTRPLAGTRRRGHTDQEDRELAEELLADPKERAEHVMLVDLGRNDLGRVCEYGSIELSELLTIERHSKVMHLVSNVEGWLRSGLDAYDVFRGVFPAGTLTGAPKVRAMEIIDELEPVRRGIFGGAIGYFSVLGDLDLCIAIRTMIIHKDRGYIQAGAGIVADSVPKLEYKETQNKARAVVRAVEMAEAAWLDSSLHSE